MIRIATSQEPTRTRCDCPCHCGAAVFHIVSCCGSLLTFPLWRAEPPGLASAADDEDRQAASRVSGPPIA